VRAAVAMPASLRPLDQDLILPLARRNRPGGDAWKKGRLAWRFGCRSGGKPHRTSVWVACPCGWHSRQLVDHASPDQSKQALGSPPPQNGGAHLPAFRLALKRQPLAVLRPS